MPDLFSVLIPLAGGAGTGLFSAVQWRRARAFDDTPTSRIRSAAQGYVELSGRARALPGEPTRSPLTGRLCLWYKYKVEERTAANREGWTTVDSGTSDDTFALDDETGSVTVDPEGADVTALDKDTWYGDEPRLSTSLRPFKWLGGIGSRYRYTECVILDGQPLAAVGFFRTQRAGDDVASLDTELALRLRDWKQDPNRMRQLDTNRDGTLSQEEWEAARAAARAEILHELHEQSAQPGWHVLQKPGDGRPFLLGTGTVAELSRRYRRTALTLLAAWALLWAVGVYNLTP
jgi:hypothetical protein